MRQESRSQAPGEGCQPPWKDESAILYLPITTVIGVSATFAPRGNAGGSPHATMAKEAVKAV